MKLTGTMKSYLRRLATGETLGVFGNTNVWTWDGQTTASHMTAHALLDRGLVNYVRPPTGYSRCVVRLTEDGKEAIAREG